MEPNQCDEPDCHDPIPRNPKCEAGIWPINGNPETCKDCPHQVKPPQQPKDCEP